MRRYSKFIIFIFCLFGSSLDTYSQDGFRLGIEYLPSLSTYSGGEISTERLFVHSINLISFQSLTKNLDLELGIGFRNLGDKIVNNGITNGLSTTAISKYTSSWVSVPLGLCWRVNKFFLSSRIYYSRNISHDLIQKVVQEGETVFDKKTSLSNGQTTYNQNLFGTQLQIGYRYFYRYHFQIGVFYDTSLGKINRDSPNLLGYNTYGTFISVSFQTYSKK